ncbi:hypothetical protein [Massilia phyllosphaerae]|uniref:hypothetical protein n=1 Tax=Massilia phyllosphaerae TaxID=3106034 RepID=UPI002B1CB88D|nr:hypothetical protein [Massilia sp. SGZ-792]
MSISVLVLCEIASFRQPIQEMVAEIGHVSLLASNDEYATEILTAIHVDVCMVFTDKGRNHISKVAEQLRKAQALLPIIAPRDMATDTDDPKLDIPISVPFTSAVLDQTIRMAKAIKIVAYYNKRD